MSRPVTGHVITNLLLLLAICVTLSNGTKKTPNGNLCSCYIFGHLYNLEPLAKLDGTPRFTAEKNNWNYAYNPCIPFSLKSPCEDVAICRWDQYEQSFTVLGLETDVQCQSSKGRPELVYSQPDSQHWITTIILKCNKSRKGVDDGTMEIKQDLSEPVLQIEHNCCCPDACPYAPPTLGPASTPVPTPASSTKTYSIIGEVVGGFIGFLLIACGIGYYCRRRHAHGERELLIADPPPDYLAVGYRNPDGEAQDPDGEAQGPDGEAQGPDGEAQHPDGEAQGPDGEAQGPDGEAQDPDGEAPDPDNEVPPPDGEAPDPDAEAPDPDGEAPDPDDEDPPPDGEAPDPDGEAPDPDDEVPPPDGEAQDPDDEVPPPDGEAPVPDDEVSPPDGEAPDPDGETPDPFGQAPDADDEASDPDSQASDSDDESSNSGNAMMRGESPHIANFIPRIRDEDLSRPIEVASSPEDQCCIEEEPSNEQRERREPVEHSL